MQIATIEYQVATYSGTIKVNCNENDDDETVAAMGRRRLIREAGALPFGYQNFKVVSRENV